MKNLSSKLLAPGDAANPVVRALAEAYRTSQLGSTGKATRAFSIRYEKLVHDLAGANVEEERRGLAILSRFESGGIVRFKRKPLARDKLLSVMIDADAETRFFELLGEKPPSGGRSDVVSVLVRHLGALSDHPYASAWKTALQDAIEDAKTGRAVDGLPVNPSLHDEILRATAAVLNNQSPVLVRRLSASQLRNSKLIERRRDAIERFMAQFLPAELAMLESWQVVDPESAVLLRGPLGVETDDGKIIGQSGIGSPYTITEETLARAQRISTSARRCLCIENITTFRETVAAETGDLLVHTSYPSSAVVKLLRSLPSTMELQHWGDTDPWGYDILRVLRQKTGRRVDAFRMNYRPGPGPLLTKRESSMIARLLEEPLLADVRADLAAIKDAGNKGLFEQESLPAISSQLNGTSKLHCHLPIGISDTR